MNAPLLTWQSLDRLGYLSVPLSQASTMSSTPNGACNSLLERDSGVGDTLHDFDRAQRISTSQEQLLRTQLQQLGLEAGVCDRALQRRECRYAIAYSFLAGNYMG